MNILLVEDDKNTVEEIKELLGDLNLEIYLDCALSRDSAYSQLAAKHYDLIICDLTIPTHDNALDLHSQHGLAVWNFINSNYPGTPTHILSGTATLDITEEITKSARQDDLFGNKEQMPLHGWTQKINIGDAIGLIEKHATEHKILNEIEIIDSNNSTIAQPDANIIRICGRRLNSSKIKTKELLGGLSGCRTYQLNATDEKDNLRGSLFAKIDSYSNIYDENERLKTFGVPMLTQGDYAPFADIVSSCSGADAGLFFKLADGYDQSLFDIIENNSEEVDGVIQAIRAIESPWSRAAYEWALSIKEIREHFLSDKTLLENLPDSLDWRSFEQNVVQCRLGHQHGDLHPANILLNNKLKPILIDFAMARSDTPIITDPLVLEMALLFHPAGRHLSSNWPSDENISNWLDLDKYLVDCPFPSYIRACRTWTMEEVLSQQELIAVAYAHTVRQMKYDVLDHDRKLALIATLMDAF